MTPAEPTLDNALLGLQELCQRDWTNIRLAGHAAHQIREKMREAVSRQSLLPADASLVVFGSLARDEATTGSDCDWTLLIDGQANGDHLEVAQSIRKSLGDLNLNQPGPSGLFGNLTFSHALVHEIGGDEDTNRNTTRRVLLLLESSAIDARPSVLVRQRVVRQVLLRYLKNEPSLRGADGRRRYPRFLLNDIVRFWRTMAVDYARKVREREHKGWALRNIKLRLSRKLIFVSGLLSCFGCRLRPAATAESSLFDDPKLRWVPLLEHLYRNSERTPLALLAEAVLLYAPTDEIRRSLGVALLDPYDSFLGLLNDDSRRTHLEQLRPESADDDEAFQHARKLGEQFQVALLRLFFETDPELREATQTYGVF